MSFKVHSQMNAIFRFMLSLMGMKNFVLHIIPFTFSWIHVESVDHRTWTFFSNFPLCLHSVSRGWFLPSETLCRTDGSTQPVTDNSVSSRVTLEKWKVVVVRTVYGRLVAFLWERFVQLVFGPITCGVRRIRQKDRQLASRVGVRLHRHFGTGTTQKVESCIREV